MLDSFAVSQYVRTLPFVLCRFCFDLSFNLVSSIDPSTRRPDWRPSFSYLQGLSSCTTLIQSQALYNEEMVTTPGTTYGALISSARERNGPSFVLLER
jgi:hypothetical protein